MIKKRLTQQKVLKNLQWIPARSNKMQIIHTIFDKPPKPNLQNLNSILIVFKNFMRLKMMKHAWFMGSRFRWHYLPPNWNIEFYHERDLNSNEDEKKTLKIDFDENFQI